MPARPGGAVVKLEARLLKPNRFDATPHDLTISKAIVELHEGRIFASSAGASHGATFVIELPNIPPGSADPASPEKEPHQSTIECDGSRCGSSAILLVDDHLDTICPMQLFLEASGYRVRTAGSVEAALQAAGQEEFDSLTD